MCRFYSKLYRRWLCERKGAGLQRVLSLLLTLAWAGDCREVVGVAYSPPDYMTSSLLRLSSQCLY